MPKPKPLTDDEPYTPDMPDEDRDEIAASTRPLGLHGAALSTRVEAVPHPPGEEPPSKQRLSFYERLDSIIDKLNAGEDLSDEDGEFMVHGGLALILRESGSKTVQLKALQTLMHSREKKLMGPRVVEHEPVDKRPKGPRPSLPS